MTLSCRGDGGSTVTVHGTRIQYRSLLISPAGIPFLLGDLVNTPLTSNVSPSGIHLSPPSVAVVCRRKQRNSN